MAVNLSPVGGVAAQFFTNTGAVLTGGKLYTYLAGTTTPATTYTTSAGDVARTNPIILDSAGRVSGSGEIWLTSSINYKFLLKDSNDVLIATYDNISSQVSTDSSLVTYDPPFTNSVATTVEAKLSQYISVTDFGAVGNGVADDTAAIQAAINSLTNGGSILFPEGTYLISAALNLSNKVNIALIGSSPVNTLQASGSQIRWASGVGTGPVVNLTGAFSIEIGNLGFYVTNNAFNGNIIEIAPGALDASGIHIHDCSFVGDTSASQIAKSISLSGVLDSVFERCMFRYGFQGIGCSGVSNNAITIRNCWFDEATTACIGMNGATGWLVQNNVFEVVATTAILNTGTMSAVNITGNWMGDEGRRASTNWKPL